MSEKPLSRETSEADNRRQKQPSPPPPAKNKRSSVYIYLAVMFAAAFLMLLLAYFVQQRNNETALDDLRSTNTASRQELLEEIETLQQENETLQAEKLELNEKLEEEQARSAELEKASEQSLTDYARMHAWYRQSHLLYCLERCRDAGEWLLMGEIVQMNDPYFNREHPDFSNEYLIPAQEARFLELREELFEKSGFMVMERRIEPDGSESAEFPMISDGTVSEGVHKTVSTLYAIIRDYALDPEYAAGLIADDFKPNSGNMEILYSGVFKSATVEWFEQIRADLRERGLSVGEFYPS